MADKDATEHLIDIDESVSAVSLKKKGRMHLAAFDEDLQPTWDPQGHGPNLMSDADDLTGSGKVALRFYEGQLRTTTVQIIKVPRDITVRELSKVAMEKGAEEVAWLTPWLAVPVAPEEAIAVVAADAVEDEAAKNEAAAVEATKDDAEDNEAAVERFKTYLASSSMTDANKSCYVKCLRDVIREFDLKAIDMLCADKMDRVANSQEMQDWDTNRKSHFKHRAAARKYANMLT